MLENTQNKFSWFDVSDDVKELLILATQTWENTQESEKYMLAALAKTRENTDVLVAAYRYFYYKNNYHLALITAEKIIAKIRELENLPDNWEAIKPILMQYHQNPNIRLYLNAYTAYGLVLAKLGNMEKAQEISNQIMSITIPDTNDKNDFGAGILLQILTRTPEDDND
ncbi:hypothetical protein H6F32_09585 [Anabaena sp. FACHB-1237]|uniref:hypothetical protein n=1 Tax=Anabaena sp. FACHB-1237 TaxID=2692769 RepID=UPI00167FE52A|nr:hypothetical protein [Anabaena sp. FACHB-1237]MBD2137834.1 hypothetical protein [Anabaena sp. FACHB-1237]